MLEIDFIVRKEKYNILIAHVYNRYIGYLIRLTEPVDNQKMFFGRK